MHQDFSLSNSRSKDTQIIVSFTKACRKDILEAVINAGSGHTGGSLSSLEFLALAYIIASQTGEKVVVSNGHVSAWVYAILAELWYIEKKFFIENFRANNSLFAGQVNAMIPGVEFTTGPLACWVSVACGIALTEKKNKTWKRVFACMGDGEFQEWQVFEMLNFAVKYKLDNLLLFIDYNKVQLSWNLKEIIDVDIKTLLSTIGWNVHHIDGHDVDKLLTSIEHFNKKSEKPNVILGNTIMWKWVEILENDGKELLSKWHWKAPGVDLVKNDLEQLTPTDEDENNIEIIRKNKKIEFHNQERFVYYDNWKERVNSNSSHSATLRGLALYKGREDKVACKDAYAIALEKIIEENDEKVVLLMADVVESIWITNVRSHFPENYFECGIAEQNMISVAGGMSVNGLIPFVSVYSNFCAKRAADQVRLNDINATNVKMVCTHAGLSVGPDGPTHHALDDVAGILALRNTLLLEPADANMMIHITKFISSIYGNCYVRMGKHPLNIITKEDGTPFYDEDYIFEYGKTDRVREWNDVTLVAIGSPCSEAFQATQKLEREWIGVEFIIASSYKDFDENILNSVQKTGKIVIVEDCFTDFGLSSNVKNYLFDRWISLSKENFVSLWPVNYHMCADNYEALYENVWISTEKILEAVCNSK